MWLAGDDSRYKTNPASSANTSNAHVEQQYQDMKLIMATSAEQCEAELASVEKQLQETQDNMLNFQQQISTSRSDPNSPQFKVLMSLLQHLMARNQYLVTRHGQLRQDIKKIREHKKNQERQQLESHMQEERYRQFLQKKRNKTQKSQT
jgi:hypothetical protein